MTEVAPRDNFDEELSDFEGSDGPTTPPSPAPPNGGEPEEPDIEEPDGVTEGGVTNDETDYGAGTDAESDGASIEDAPVTGEDKEIEEGEEPDDNEKRIAAAICLLCCFLCCLIIALLAVFLRPDSEPLARSQADPFTDSPTPLPTELFTLSPTTSPTPEPTDSPTVTGATSRPTLNPTKKPTPAPTLPPFDIPRTLSRLPCSEIRLTPNATDGNFGTNNFKLYDLPSGIQACGDTFDNNPDSPNRNPWSVARGRRDCKRFNFSEGIAICDVVGARWCTVEEFDAEVAQGTGCGGDRELVYTDSNCETEEGVAGKIMFDVGLRDNKRPFYECESDLNRLSLARCCGDVY